MTVFQELNTDVDALKESQLADAQLRPIIKALQEGNLHHQTQLLDSDEPLFRMDS